MSYKDQAHSAIRRIARNPGAFACMTRREIADVLGISYRTVDRMLARLRKEGIDVQYKHGKRGAPIGHRRTSVISILIAQPDKWRHNTVEEIAEELHVAQSTITNAIYWAKKEGVRVKFQRNYRKGEP